MNISKIIVEIIAVDLSGREKELAADPKKKINKYDFLDNKKN